MPRVQLILEYDGTDYAGWQRQENAIAVAQRVEEAWFKITRERVPIIGASRTDAGVHARGQSAHVDTLCAIPAEKLPYALNTALPRDIRVLSCAPRPDTFHACFSTTGKRYEYSVVNRPHASALRNRYSWHVYYPLDLRAMRAAADALVGTHDFAAFCASGASAKTTVRTIHKIEIARAGDEVLFSVVGNGFLYNMVRIIVGTLVEIGSGRLAADTVDVMLATRAREKGGVTAPPQGLTLCAVYYT